MQAMKAPGDKRGDGCFGVVQIIVTNRCDGACSNCTQMIPYQRSRVDMSPSNFRRAVDSVAGYPGVVGMFGGNPCLHPKFPELCEMFREHGPDKPKRGIWSNDIHGHGALVSATFGYHNFNVHGCEKAATRMRAAVPDAKIWGIDTPSIHAPVMVYPPEDSNTWDAVAQCAINQHWSAAIVERGGDLLIYYCEVAAAMANVLGVSPDHDRMPPVEPGVLDWQMDIYSRQIQRYCRICGVPLSLSGRPDNDRTDDMCLGWAKFCNHSSCKRKQNIVESGGMQRTNDPTDYQGLRSDRSLV